MYDNRPSVRLIKVIDDTVVVIKGHYGFSQDYEQELQEHKEYIDQLLDETEINYNQVHLPIW